MRKITQCIFAGLALMTVNGAAFGQFADPFSGGVLPTVFNAPVGDTVPVIFQIGNGAGAGSSILANSVEWTFNFPLNLSIGITPGYTFPNSPFYVYSLITTGSDHVMIVRNNPAIPVPVADPAFTEFEIQVPVIGTIANDPGTITANNHVIPGFNGTVGNLDANNDNASAPIIFAGALPVDLLSFESVAAGSCAAGLKWQTGKEDAFIGFDIERSADAQDFKKIGQVSARGNGSSYTFKYDNAPQGKSYFRLKLKDRDGYSRYSDVISAYVDCAAQRNIKVYPTVVSGGKVRVDGVLAGDKVMLTDVAGRHLWHTNAQQAVEQVDLSGFAAGTYYIIVRTGNKEPLSFKVLKQ